MILFSYRCNLSDYKDSPGIHFYKGSLRSTIYYKGVESFISHDFIEVDAILGYGEDWGFQYLL